MRAGGDRADCSGKKKGFCQKKKIPAGPNAHSVCVAVFADFADFPVVFSRPFRVCRVYRLFSVFSQALQSFQTFQSFQCLQTFQCLQSSLNQHFRLADFSDFCESLKKD